MGGFKEKIKEFFPFAVFILTVSLLLFTVLKVTVLKQWELLRNPLPDLFQGVSFGDQAELDKISLDFKEEKPEEINPESLIELNHAIQGLFTELFSGQGWKNRQRSDVYQDPKTSVISLPPDYKWEEVFLSSDGKAEVEGNKLKGEGIVVAKGNGKETVLVNRKGEILALNEDEKIFKGESLFKEADRVKSGLFSWDSENDKWILILLRDKKINIFTFKVKKSGIIYLLSSEIDYEISDFNNIGLACMRERCLLSLENKIWQFSLNNLPKDDFSAAKEINPFEYYSGKVNSNVFEAGDYWILGGVFEKDGEYKSEIKRCDFELKNCQKLIDFSSKYKGTLHFGYDEEKEELLSIYAAYIGKAFKTNISSQKTEDWSRFFPQRVMEGSTSRYSIKLEIFYQKEAWWIGSLSRSPGAKLLRIEGGVGIDFTPVLLQGIQRFQLAPGFRENEVYGIIEGADSCWIYKFIDLGFKESRKVSWESLKLNSLDGYITKGRIKKVEGGENRGYILYFLSNNGGEEWIRANLGELIEFDTVGRDFRWRAEFYPSENKFETPWLNLATVEYFIIKE